MQDWVDPEGSDKHFWHRYSAFYRRHFAALGTVRAVLEFGVLHGASIAWLRRLFPDATIVGIDVLPPRPDWPAGPGIRYVQADQGDRPGLMRALADLPDGVDLVIEDASHVPAHQVATLACAFPKLRAGGLYVLEDLHTSLPEHPLARAQAAPGLANALHLVLAIERARALGRALTPAEAGALAAPGMFSGADVAMLSARVGAVEIFRRACLPLRCWSCGSGAFDPVALRCACGIDMSLSAPDSMTAAMRAG